MRSGWRIVAEENWHTAYRGVRRIGDKGTGSRRRFVFSLSPRGTSGEGRGEGKALKTLLENDLVFRPPLPDPPLREHRLRRGDESRRSGLAKARRTVLPLLGERAGVRGKKRSANQHACELPMKSTTLREGTQRSRPGKAQSP